MQQVFPRENRNVYSWIYLGGKNRPFQCVEYVHEPPFASTYLYAYRNPSMILQASCTKMTSYQLTNLWDEER